MKTTLPRSIDELRIFPSCEEKEKSVPACCLMGASFLMPVFKTPVEMTCRSTHDFASVLKMKINITA
jgi:hypothetical protein